MVVFEQDSLPVVDGVQEANIPTRHAVSATVNNAIILRNLADCRANGLARRSADDVILNTTIDGDPHILKLSLPPGTERGMDITHTRIDRFSGRKLALNYQLRPERSPAEWPDITFEISEYKRFKRNKGAWQKPHAVKLLFCAEGLDNIDSFLSEALADQGFDQRSTKQDSNTAPPMGTVAVENTVLAHTNSI